MASHFSANTRETKHQLLYDGHNRNAGVNTHDKALKWRRIRRRFARWMRDTADRIDERT